MYYRTRNENSVIARKYDDAVNDNEFVYDTRKLKIVYRYDYLEYFYDAEMTAIIVCVVKDGATIALMAYNFTEKTNLKVYKLLRIAYNHYRVFEFICLLENVISLKWCLRFSKRNKMKVIYDSENELVKFIKEE